MKRWWITALIIVVGVWQIKNLWGGWWPSSHDGIFHLIRLEEIKKMIEAGYFPVRWGLNLDNGYGVPVFNFVYPGPYYSAWLLTIVGLKTTTALKMTVALFYLLGGWGVFEWLKERGWKKAVAGAIVYLALPYQFVDIFVRGAYGEVAAMGLLPWLMVTMDRTNNWKKGALVVGLLLISHSFISWLALGLMMGYLVITKKMGRQQLKSLTAGLAIAAFFWLPMAGESRWLGSGRDGGFTFDYREHFVYFKQLIYGKWDYWYSLPGENDGMSFQLGIASIMSLVLAVFILIKNRFRDKETRWWVLGYAGAVFLMLPGSDWVWRIIKILQIVQFPWRWLFLTVFLTPGLLVGALAGIKEKKWRAGWGIMIVSLALINSRNYRRPMLQLSREETEKQYDLLARGTTTVVRSEVAPYWAKETPYKTREVEWVGENQKIIEAKMEGKSLVFEVEGGEGKKIRINRNYFPSWKLETAKGEKVAIGPGENGEIVFEPRPGLWQYKLKLGSTWLETVANLVSIIGIICLLA